LGPEAVGYGQRHALATIALAEGRQQGSEGGVRLDDATQMEHTFHPRERLAARTGRGHRERELGARRRENEIPVFPSQPLIEVKPELVARGGCVLDGRLPDARGHIDAAVATRAYE